MNRANALSEYGTIVAQVFRGEHAGTRLVAWEFVVIVYGEARGNALKCHEAFDLGEVHYPFPRRYKDALLVPSGGVKREMEVLEADDIYPSGDCAKRMVP